MPRSTEKVLVLEKLMVVTGHTDDSHEKLKSERVIDAFKIYLRTAYFWFYVHILNTFWLVTIFVNKGLSQIPPDRKTNLYSC